MKVNRTAIIIPFRNLSWITINCLKSISASTDLSTIRVYLVDNNSEVLEAEKILGYLNSSEIDYRHIVMSKNTGFVVATNTGIKRAIKDDFEQFVLLNNDTIVTSSWLVNLQKHLKNDVCFVNPMSSPPDWRSTVWGKALIEEKPDYSKIRPSMESFASSLLQNFKDKVTEVDFVPFFCTLIHKRAIDEVGFLSEDYEVGLFDDDDYCHRSREKNLKMVVAQDTYVHHFHNSTFIDQNIDYMKLLEKNRKVFEEKYHYDPWDRAKVKQ